VILITDRAAGSDYGEGTRRTIFIAAMEATKMATKTNQLVSVSGPAWINGGVAGLIAGLVFAMWAMVIGAFTPGSNLLAPPQGIAQSIGIGSQGHDIQALPLLIGLMGHMMNSVIFGLVFVAIVAALKLRGTATVVAGMAYGLAVYLVMYLVVLRGLLSGSSASFLSANPEWSWILAHLMFGVVMGALLAYRPLARGDERS
jgi:uncharacterized membrane protein YagU involved in acid resistance